MYVYYMYVYMCVIASMYVNAHGGLNDVRFLQSFLFIHFVYQGQFILFLSCQTWSSPLLAPVASQSALGVLFILSKCCKYWSLPSTLLFTWFLGIRTPVLMLVQQTLDQLSHLPNPNSRDILESPLNKQTVGKKHKKIQTLFR